VDAPSFEHDIRDIDPDGRTRGDVSFDILDGPVWRTFRQHLLRELEKKALAVELPYPLLVVLRNPQESHTRPIRFDPLHLPDITLHEHGPVVRIPHKRQVLTACEGFREAEATASRRHIDHLPTGEASLINDDHAKSYTRSHRPSWLSPLFLLTLFGEDRYGDLHGECTLHARPPLRCEWISNAHAERRSPSLHRIVVMFDWGQSLGADAVYRLRFGG
jgi:hypothetical protein